MRFATRPNALMNAEADHRAVAMPMIRATVPPVAEPMRESSVESTAESTSMPLPPAASAMASLMRSAI